jgi:hypothetical protein
VTRQSCEICDLCHLKLRLETQAKAKSIGVSLVEDIGEPRRIG